MMNMMYINLLKNNKNKNSYDLYLVLGRIKKKNETS